MNLALTILSVAMIVLYVAMTVSYVALTAFCVPLTVLHSGARLDLDAGGAVDRESHQRPAPLSPVWSVAFFSIAHI